MTSSYGDLNTNIQDTFNHQRRHRCATFLHYNSMLLFFDSILTPFLLNFYSILTPFLLNFDSVLLHFGSVLLTVYSLFHSIIFDVYVCTKRHHMTSSLSGIFEATGGPEPMYSGRSAFCITNDEFCIKHDELCIKIDEFCIKVDEFCIKNDEFW